MSYDNTNRGVLFKNDRKEKDSHPDYKGNLNVDGQEFWLDAWIKKSKDGSKTFMSVSVKPKGEQRQQPKQAPADNGAPFSDDIPFSPRLTE